MRNATPVHFTRTCNDPAIIASVHSLGAEIEYNTERTLTFVLNGARMTLAHNWDDERYVTSITCGHPDGPMLEQQVKEVVES